MSIFNYRAILFDLDGVITPTADLHRAAWNHIFTQYLREHHAANYTDQDYYNYLDGRPRLTGIAALLDSRGITLPTGEETDTYDPTRPTLHALGNWKNTEFLRLVERGIQPYPGSLALLQEIRRRQSATNTTTPSAAAASTTHRLPAPDIAIVSSSKNARPVLRAAGIEHYFPVIIDGLTAAAHGIAGKPAPDTYLYGAGEVGVEPKDAVVVEDATSGCEAGRAGQFGLVVGVDRGAGETALRAAGAHTVVADLAELLPNSHN